MLVGFGIQLFITSETGRLINSANLVYLTTFNNPLFYKNYALLKLEQGCDIVDMVLCYQII